MQDLNPGSQTPNRQQTECSLTNRLSYRGSSLKTWTRQPVPMISEHSAHLTPLSVDFRTWLWRYTYLLLLSETGPWWGRCIWKAIWVFIQHFPISGIISRYREFEFPISGNQFPISGNNQFPDIGKWFSDIGNWFSDIGKCVWFSDIRKSIPDIRKSPNDKQVTSPPCNTALPCPLSTTAPSKTGPIGDRHYDFSKSHIYAKLDQCNQQ